MNNTEKKNTATEKKNTEKKNTENKNTENKNTENKNTDTENKNTDKKRAILIKLLMSSFVDSDEEELMDAFDNQNEMPWSCGK